MVNVSVKPNMQDNMSEVEDKLESQSEIKKRSSADREIADLFMDMRQSSGQSVSQLADILQTDTALLQALEEGALDRLPAWKVSSPVISRYAQFLGLDSQPILRRLALHIQAKEKQKEVESQQVVAASHQALKSNDNAISSVKEIEPIASESKEKEAVKQEGIPQRDILDLKGSVMPDPPKVMTSEPIKRPTEEVSLKRQPVLKQAIKTPKQAQNDLSLEALLVKKNKKTKTVTASIIPSQEPVFRPIDPAIPAATRAPSKNQSTEKTIGYEVSQTATKEETPAQTSMVPPVMADLTLRAEGSIAGDKAVLPRQKTVSNDSALRADKRDFPQTDKPLMMPRMSDLLDEPAKTARSPLMWVGIAIVTLAVAYLGWMVYSQPRIMQILLDQLPM